MTESKRTIEIPYKPHPKQILLHLDSHRFRTVVCGRRFGKTIFAINELIKQAFMKKGMYWYIAPTYKQAKMIAWETLKYYAKDCYSKKNESDLELILLNGSKLKLLGAENEDSLRGAGLEGVIFDEYSDIKPNVWEQIVRPMLLVSQGWGIFLGTPKGKNHFYENFIKDEDKYDKNYTNRWGESCETDNDFKSFQFKTLDNPYIPSKEIEKARRETNEEYFRQEYEASFETYAGIIYKEWRDDLLFKDIKLNPRWHYWIGIDTGRHTGITFACVDFDNTMWIFDEIYDFDGIVSDISEQIREVLSKWKVEIEDCTIIIDSASQVKREFIANNIYVYDSQKDVENSINVVRDRMKNKQIRIQEDCKHHIFEHTSYVWDDRPRLSGQPVPKKENDHTVNAVQYVLNSMHMVKPHDEKVYSLEDLKKKDIFDKEFEDIEDNLGITWRGGHIAGSEEIDEDGVVAY